jgi:hypothetical protein
MPNSQRITPDTDETEQERMIKSWKNLVATDRERRIRMIEKITNPGPYTASEEANITMALNVINNLENRAKLKKYDTRSPLHEASMFFDKESQMTFGKVSCDAWNATLLDVVAHLADYDSNYNKMVNLDDPNIVKTCVLEDVNNHHQILYFQGRLPPPFQNRDLCWSRIVKRISEDQFLCVLQPTTHPMAPTTPEVVRAESTRIYRIARRSPMVTRIELFVTIDLMGSIPGWINRTLIIPAALTVSFPTYFLQNKEYNEYDAQDATRIAQYLMDQIRTLDGQAREDSIRSFFTKTAALRSMCEKYSWFLAMIQTLVKNEIRPSGTRYRSTSILPIMAIPERSTGGVLSTSSTSESESGLESPPLSESRSSLPSESRSSPTGSTRLRRFTNTASSWLHLHAMARHESSQIHTITESEAITIGQSLAIILLSNATADSAVDDFILRNRFLTWLDHREPKFFRPFVTCIAQNILERSSLGARLRVFSGVTISVLDMVSDIAMIFNFIQTGHSDAANVTIGLIVANLSCQLLLVYVQNIKKPLTVFLKEAGIVLSCFKPGVDAFRVLRCVDDDPLLTMHPLMEMNICKGCEIAIEAIPSSVIQCAILLRSPTKSSVAIFSLTMSVLSTAYTATSIFYDIDTSLLHRQRNPTMWGAIPDTDRGIVFVTLILISAFQMAVKVLSCSLLAIISIYGLIAWLSVDIVIHLMYKILRRDFVYFVPGTRGVVKYAFSFANRAIMKIIADFTSLLNARVATEMGGIYFSVNMVLNHLRCWIAAAIFVHVRERGGGNRGDEQTSESLDTRSIYTLIGGFQLLWLASVVLFLFKIKRSYIKSFYSLETGRQFIHNKFLKNTDDEKRMEIVRDHVDLWVDIRDDVKRYSLANWNRWETEKPAWFDDKFISIMRGHRDFIPVP